MRAVERGWNGMETEYRRRDEMEAIRTEWGK